MERDLDKELRFHFDCRVDDLMRSGLSEHEARRRTRIEFGGIEQVKEDCRDARGTVWLDAVLADVRYAARTLRKNPGYSAATIAILALGIGANTAIFSVVNAVLLRPLAYAQPERLVWATEYYPKFNRTRVFAPEYAAWKRQNTVFERLEAYWTGAGMNLAAGNQIAERVQVGQVTPGFFTMLGIQPRLGRAFRPDEDRSSNRVVILSDALWRNYFQADPEILRKPIRLDGAPYTVIGVMPPGFHDLGAVDTGVWLPDAMGAQSAVPARAMRFLDGVIGRLKPGATVEQARANLEVIARRMDSQYPAPWSTYHAAATVQALPLQRQLTSGSRTAVYVLMGAVIFILLIACANVANVFLARAVARTRELAIRAAIGAGRSRIVRLLFLESLLLGSLGGLIGIALARWGVPALAFLVPASFPREIPIDIRVLGFAVLCSLAAVFAFGLAPALTASRLDLNTCLKEGGGRPVRRRFRVRSALAVAQLALSLVLLAGAGLLIRSFLSLMSVNPGFDTRNVLLADISLAPAELYGPSQQANFFCRVLEAVEKVPGIETAAVTSESPLAMFNSLASGLAAEGGPETDATVVPTSTSAGYFQALRIPLLSGRFFNDSDGGAVIINRELARILFPNLDPVGRRIRFGRFEERLVTVIGVVADIRHLGLDDHVWAEIYEPFEQAPSPWMRLVIKTSAEPLNLAPAIRKAVAGIDRTQPLFAIESLDQRLSNSVAQRRQRMLLLGAFAFLALVIALIGIYSVMAYSVARRTHEMGIRIALGAQARDVRRMVVAEGLRMALTGVAIGCAGALALTRVLSSFLYGVTATDPATFISVCVALIAAACLASYIPARRATRVDPLTALRSL
jgi:putative ABC transport system permease protein